MAEVKKVNSEQWWDEKAEAYRARKDNRERPSEYSEAARHVGKGPVLELGCAFGAFSAYVPTVAYCGLDISQAMINEARLRFPERLFLQGDITAMPPRWNGSVATVCAFQVLEHFTWEYLEKIVNRIQAIATQRLVLSVPKGMPSKPSMVADGHLIGWENEKTCSEYFSRWGEVQLVPCDKNHVMLVVQWRNKA